MRIPRRTTSTLAVSLTVLLGGGLAPVARAQPDPPTAPSTPSSAPVKPSAPCAKERAAIDDLERRIDEHNSRNDGPAPQAEADAYNAEAERLNGEKPGLKDALSACADAVADLVGGGFSVATLTELAERIGDQLTREAAAVPKGWTPPAGPYSTAGGGAGAGGAGGGGGQSGTTVLLHWTLPPDYPVVPLRDTLAANRPETRTGASSNGGKPDDGDHDPAFPGGVFGSDPGEQPQVDDLVTIDELVTIPRFSELTPAEMISVANSEDARTWVSLKTRIAAASPSAAAVLGLDPAWVEDRADKRDKALKKIKDTVDKILKGRHG